MADQRVSELSALTATTASDMFYVVHLGTTSMYILWPNLIRHWLQDSSAVQSSATSGYLLQANESGLPVNASMTDAQLSATVSASHARLHNLTGTLDHTSNLTSGYVLIADTNGLPATGTNTDAQISGTVASAHAKLHNITSTNDHTSNATPGYLLKADANGLPVTAFNTDAQVSAAVGNSHAPVTLDASAAKLLTLSTQQIGLSAQTANFVLAGPTGGVPDVAGFRALVTADIPNLGALYAASSKGVDFGNAHTHVTGDGALIVESAQTLADLTSWNATTTHHGYVPKLPNDATLFYNGTGGFSTPPGGNGTANNMASLYFMAKMLR